MVKLSNRWWGLVWRYWYPYVTSKLKDTELVFMNYGYHTPELNENSLRMEPEDEAERYFGQLYYQLACKVDLAGKDVLEVSSGHGGGASFVMRYLKPASYTGLERNPQAVAFTQQRHNVSGLRFVEGDAQAMQFADEQFDVVLNVEASHAYAEPLRFYQEVARVLKPGGMFLTTDFRPLVELEQWRAYVLSSGLTLLEEQDITQQVVASMELVSEQRAQMIDERISWPFRAWFRQFAGVQGSTVFQNLANGTWTYRNFILQK